MDLGVIYIKDDNGCLEAVRGGRAEARRDPWVIVPITATQGKLISSPSFIFFP